MVSCQLERHVGRNPWLIGGGYDWDRIGICLSYDWDIM
jgi:hypothetical protein